MTEEHRIKENDLKDIENKYKFIMSEDIRKHYLKYNGRYQEKSMYITSNGNEFIVDWFIPC